MTRVGGWGARPLYLGMGVHVYRVPGGGGPGAARRRLLDFGVLPGTVVEIIRAAPLGDPVELRLRGYTLTLRRADGAQVTVEPGRQLRREEGRDWIW